MCACAWFLGIGLWGVGAGYTDSTNKLYSKGKQCNANVPLKYTKLIGGEGHVHNQT